MKKLAVVKWFVLLLRFDGAYGALIALDAYEIGEETTLLSLEELAAFTSEKEFTHCGLCENNCQLTVTVFSDGRQFTEIAVNVVHELKLNEKNAK